jgi:hypothetical protein
MIYRVAPNRSDSIEAFTNVGVGGSGCALVLPVGTIEFSSIKEMELVASALVLALAKADSGR